MINQDREVMQQALEALEMAHIFLKIDVNRAIENDRSDATIREAEESERKHAKAIAALRARLAEPEPHCGCHKCNEGVTIDGIPFASARMILCPTCGNKRCPHASDHRLACTDSNEPGQAGSVYAVRAEPEPEPKAFDHFIGDGRFKVVRGAYWWHIQIGDSLVNRGKFHTQSGAEEMALLLLREFRNGAWVARDRVAAETAPPTRRAIVRAAAKIGRSMK